jgi:DNA helicase-2/ATP-dependent DNA helicase PcrA
MQFSTEPMLRVARLKKPLSHYGVPYRIVGGVRFYDRKEIKDLLAYIRLISAI